MSTPLGYPYPPIVGGRAINPYREPDVTNSTKVFVKDRVREFTEKLHNLRAFEEWSFQAAKRRFMKGLL